MVPISVSMKYKSPTELWKNPLKYDLTHAAWRRTHFPRFTNERHISLQAPKDQRLIGMTACTMVRLCRVWGYRRCESVTATYINIGLLTMLTEALGADHHFFAVVYLT